MMPPETMGLTLEELEGFLARIEGVASPQDYEIARALVETVRRTQEILEGKNASIDRLRNLLFGPKTEKTRNVFPDTEEDAPDASRLAQSDNEGADDDRPPKKRKGHGRNGADAYTGAERIPVPHETLTPGDICPSCTQGKVYSFRAPAKKIRIVGQPFLKATVYELERVRCNLCGEVFTARLPEEAGSKKYDETAGSAIVVHRYGNGFPHNRMEMHQKDMGIPLPSSTQWDIVNEVARKVDPVYQELIRQAAQGEVIHNDDTGMKILALMGSAAKGEGAPEGADRTGIFTTGVISMTEGRKIALFFTGRQHAGENLEDVLEQRESGRGPPIQMCDALSRNAPKEPKTILGNCNAHGRRQFVDVAPNFPEECRYVLETLKTVYKNDALAREQGMSPTERLAFHQAASGPIMETLQGWLKAQSAERRVEPNSGLGKAIAYMLRHWEPLTLFLREPGAPLDNNVVERALKMAIRHRRNSLFYKTERGAEVGDIFMSLIQTCRLCGANPFDYLTVLQRHADRVREAPADWMPWNYEQALVASHPIP
jgi:transposase